MKAVMLGLALGLAMGCGKKEGTEPQGQANAPVKPTAPVSKEEPPKSSSKTNPKPEPNPANQNLGTVLWEFETGGEVGVSPALGADGILYVGSLDKKVYAIKTDSKGLAKSPWPMRGQNPQHTGRAPKK